MAPEEPRWYDRFSDSTRLRLRWIALGLLGLVGLYAAAHVTLHAVFDAEYVEDTLNDRLAASTDSAYQIDIDAVHWGLLRRSAQADEMTLQPLSNASGRSSSLQVYATASQVRILGIHLRALLWNGNLRLGTVAVQQPHVHVEASGTGEQSSRKEEQADTSSLHATLARSLPQVNIRQISIDEGRLSLDQKDRPSPSDSLWNLSVEIQDVAIDSASARDTSRVLFSDAATVSFDGYRHVSSDSLYTLTLGPVRTSTQDSSLTANTVHLTPTVSDEAFMRRHEYRANRFETAAGQLTLDGLDLRNLIEERALLVETAHVDSLIVDVYRDNHLPPHPEAPLPKTMPHEAVRDLDQPLRIDTLRVTNSYVAYTKRDKEASEPGTITFEDLSASVYNLTNDPHRMTPQTPAVIDARTRVAGAGQLQATIRLPLLSPHLTFSFEGKLGPMDARAFNTAFVDMSGIRIENGQVDSLWFEGTVQRGNATGFVQGMYRNLEIEMLDQESREQEFPDRIKTFVVNDMTLESENTPEDSSLRSGDIDHEYPEGDTFLKFLWHTVRSGLYSLVGL